MIPKQGFLGHGIFGCILYIMCTFTPLPTSRLALLGCYVGQVAGAEWVKPVYSDACTGTSVKAVFLK